MLEFEDIQHITLTRVPAITGRYEFLSFREPRRKGELGSRAFSTKWPRLGTP